MRVWLINPYGTLPGEAWRPYRTAMQAQALALAGHEVSWWISTLQHRTKKFRAAEFEKRSLPDGAQAFLVPSGTYSSHISLARIQYERAFAREVVARASAESPPDVLVVVDPALFFGLPIAEWAVSRGARLVVDIMDLWPELFRIALPPAFRFSAPIVFSPLYARRQRLLRMASGVTAVSKDYLEPARDASVTCPTLVSYIGGAPLGASTDEGLAELVQRYRLPERKSTDMWFVYAGTLGAGYDVSTLIASIALIAEESATSQFLIAGDGPRRADVEALARKYPRQVHYVGVVDPQTLDGLYKLCDVGLSLYAPESTVSMPTKIYDYFFAGLAVLNSLGRECGELIEHEQLGWNFRSGDVQRLAEAFRSCLANPVEVARRGANALAVAERFDASRQSKAFADFVSDLA